MFLTLIYVFFRIVFNKLITYIKTKIRKNKMYNLKIVGQINVVKPSEFNGKKSVKVQMFNITDKNIDVINIKLHELDKLEDVKKDTNCEIEVKLFTPEDKKDIYFSRVSQIKYLK